MLEFVRRGLMSQLRGRTAPTKQQGTSTLRRLIKVNRSREAVAFGVGCCWRRTTHAAFEHSTHTCEFPQCKPKATHTQKLTPLTATYPGMLRHRRAPASLCVCVGQKKKGGARRACSNRPSTCHVAWLIFFYTADAPQVGRGGNRDGGRSLGCVWLRQRRRPVGGSGKRRGNKHTEPHCPSRADLTVP